MKKSLPTFTHEQMYWKKGYNVIGIDEVGRGPLAGPTTVGVVCFKPLTASEISFWSSLGIHDSKKLTAKKREELSQIIKEKAHFCSVVFSNVGVIDNIGIVPAIQNAACQAVKNIPATTPLFALLDAFYIKDLPRVPLQQQKAIIRGDQICISIAAASIIAKVARDEFMNKIATDHPHYGWETNKGYGTKKHIEAIKKYGATEIHRKLFIRNIIG